MEILYPDILDEFNSTITNVIILERKPEIGIVVFSYKNKHANFISLYVIEWSETEEAYNATDYIDTFQKTEQTEEFIKQMYIEERLLFWIDWGRNGIANLHMEHIN